MTEASERSHRPLVGLWGSAGLSISGNAMVEVLVVWLVLRQTGSASDAGLVTAAALGAAVVALFFGGALLDTSPPRTSSGNSAR